MKNFLKKLFLSSICISILLIMNFSFALDETLKFNSVDVAKDLSNPNIMNANTSRNLAVSDEGIIYAVFRGIDSSDGSTGIYVSRSVDGGESFLTPVLVAKESYEPEIAVSSSGYVYVTFSNGGFLKLFRSDDNGVTFEEKEVKNSLDADLNISSWQVHMATDGPNIYFIGRSGTTVFYNNNSGDGHFYSTPVGNGYVFSDIHVDKENHIVIVIKDNPNVVYSISEDYGHTFTDNTSTGGRVYHSVGTFSGGQNGKYAFVAGSGLTSVRIDVENNLYKMDMDVGSNSNSQGRSMNADAYGNVVTGFVSGSEVKFKISNDLGESFSDDKTVGVSNIANAFINPTNGELLYLYQGEVGGIPKLLLNTYENLTIGYDIKLSSASVSFDKDDKEKTVTIENISDDPIKIDNLLIDEGFIINSDDKNRLIGSIINPGERESIRVKFLSEYSGTTNGTLSISIEGKANTRNILLTGTQTDGIVKVKGSKNNDQKIFVYNGIKGATLKLYDLDDNLVGTSIMASGSGLDIFSSVPTGDGYYVTQEFDGKVSDASQKISVLLGEDTVGPVITLAGVNPVNIEKDGVYIEEGAVSYDNVDGKLNVITSALVDTSKIGSYEVTYTSSDSSGNETKVIRTVNVAKKENLFITSIGKDKATVEATINVDDGVIIKERGFLYSTEVEDPQLGNFGVINETVSVTTGAMTVVLTDLEANTKYYVRGYISSEDDTFYGIVKNFTTGQSYGINEIEDQVMRNLEVGYSSASREKKTITLTKTGTGDIDNLTIRLDRGKDSAFEFTGYLTKVTTSSETKTVAEGVSSVTTGSATTVTTGGATVVTTSGATTVATVTEIITKTEKVKTTSSEFTFNLTNDNPTATVELLPKNGLGVGTYKENVTISSSNMNDQNFKITQVIESSSSGKSNSYGGSSSSKSPSSPDPVKTKPVEKTEENGTSVLVNGKTETAATSDTSKKDGKVVTNITLNDDKIREKVESEKVGSKVTIPVSDKVDIVVGTLNGQTIKKMEEKQAILEIKTEKASYTIPAEQINIDAISKAIGDKVRLKDIIVSVEIGISSPETVETIDGTADKNGYKTVISPVRFSVKCKKENKIVEVKEFTGYVSRSIPLPEGMEPNKITTGVVLNNDNTLSHVPTAVELIGGKYYAKINSLTNSDYTIILNEIEFKDVDEHWAKDSINDMGSRLIMTGLDNGNFEPDTGITRGEFSSVIVKALGIMRSGEGKRVFTDVDGSNKYYNGIGIAVEYNLIKGYGDGKFRPDKKITREEAMTVISRAMKITNKKGNENPEFTEKFLKIFEDGINSSSWSKDGIADCVAANIIPVQMRGMVVKDNISKGEVAVIVRNLLKRSGLI